MWLSDWTKFSLIFVVGCKTGRIPSSTLAHYREKLKEWEEVGWRIDQDEVDSNKMKVAYAISSPARRTSKNWTLDPVPLVPAKTGVAASNIANLNRNVRDRKQE